MSNEKILLVDDEDSNLRLLTQWLVPLGYDIELASNGEEAVRKARDGETDLIILDIMMPVMDGHEACRILKTDPETRNIPIIMVTAFHSRESRLKGLSASANDFLSKPIDQSELIIRVQNLLKIKAFDDLTVNYRKELEAEVAKRTEELKHAFEMIKAASLETIYRLSMAAEYKDEDTGAHIKRMSLYAAAVARRMGLDDNSIENILYAVPMHDLGKIGIPDRILLKPGRLDPEEWKIMKQHTVLGAQILKGSKTELIRMGESIAQNHHEKWDGSGYPEGIEGVAIPIDSRIAAIADVFDALTSKRPYKEAFSVKKSLGIIREGRGSHFDPDVADAFFAIQDEILTIILIQ